MTESFKSLDSFKVRGHDVHAVELASDVTDFDHLIGHDVEIDGTVYRCIGVERFAHNPPWRKGEKIGIMVAPRNTKSAPSLST
jgi:hypothetical protein